MQIVKPEKYADYEETFIFDSDEGLGFAEAILKRAKVDYVVPKVEGEQAWLIQVNGERIAERVQRLIGKRFSFGKRLLWVTPDVTTGKLLKSHAYPCTLIRMTVPAKVEHEIESSR